MTSTSVCVSCNKEAGGAHKCQKCEKPCHVICGKPIGKEGYGQAVTCNKCLDTPTIPTIPFQSSTPAGTSASGSTDPDEMVNKSPEVQSIHTAQEHSDGIEKKNENRTDLNKSPEKDSVISIEDEDSTESGSGSGWTSGCINIPDHLYSIIPEEGQYLVEIMKFCGYCDVESVVQLKNAEKRVEMFDFVKDMLEVIEDKEKMLSIFARIPGKLQILPGVVTSFDLFLDEVEKLRPSKNNIASSEKSDSGKGKKRKTAAGKLAEKPNTSDSASNTPSQKKKKETSALTGQSLTLLMDEWMKKKKFTQTYTISESDGSVSQYLHIDEMGEDTGGRIAHIPIPEHLWEMIPDSGHYIKSIMQYTGYGHVDSAIRLKDPQTLKNMFEFAALVTDSVVDKVSMYGTFAAKPEKLCVLPGLKKHFLNFILEIEKINGNTGASAVVRDTPRDKPSCSRKRPSKDVVIEDIRGQIDDWLEQNSITRLYRVNNDNNNFTYICLHCHWKTVLVIHEDVACFKDVCNHITNHCIVHASVDLPETEASISSSVKWNSRSFRNREKLLKASMEPNQTKITEFFDIETFSSSVNDIVFIRKKVNETLGTEQDMTIAPILKLLYSNALSNANVKSKSGCRHEEPVKMFAAYMFCLIGKAGYEFIQCNVGTALPSLPTIMRMISKFPRIREGEFMFDEVAEHLKKWKAPPYIHVHMDDTRVINKIEYDLATDRFIGFVLPIENGLPKVNAFILSTFDELKNSFETSAVANYAHVIVAKPLTAEAPSFVFFVLGTDSKYDHRIILERWNHIETELNKRGIKVISFGADGAGCFMKAMLLKTGLFYPTDDLYAKSYVMKEIATTGLSAQDHIHLLAKLRTRLLIPSNILVLGDETACLEHLKYILRNCPKEKHQLTKRIVNNKDKQNYGGIEILLSEGVFDCLEKSKTVMETFGTITYLTIMRDIRDSFLDKSLKPSARLYLMWKVVFFLRIWRRWLRDCGRPEKDHFITNNAYVCVEINAHLMLQIVNGVIKGTLPIEALRFWITGSQGCEEIFRLARSMTPTFSTIVNFSMKGILEKMHKLNFLSTMECSSNEITFPRVKRRLLQCEKEGDDTFALFPLDEIDTLIQSAKDEAKRMAADVGMVLESDADSYMLSDVVHVLAKAVEEDGEDEDYSDPTDSIESTDDDPDHDRELIVIQEDLVSLRLSKSSSGGLPTYDVSSMSKGTVKSKTYSLNKNNKSPFLLYNDRYIRKSTALYLLQEKMSLSSDRPLRVRKKQLSHIHNDDSDIVYPENHIKTCDLCVFKRVDDQSKFAVGRVLQFSYMRGSKKEREFSGDYVDFDVDAEMSYIGAFCNWYVGEEKDSEIGFVLTYNYAQGYLSLDNYVMKIPENQVVMSEKYAFIIRKEYLNTCLEDYSKVL